MGIPHLKSQGSVWDLRKKEPNGRTRVGRRIILQWTFKKEDAGHGRD